MCKTVAYFDLSQLLVFHKYTLAGAYREECLEDKHQRDVEIFNAK